MNSKFVTLLFIVTAVVAVFFAGLMIYLFVFRDNVIDEVVIERDGVTEVELVVDDLEVIPGSSKEYDLVIKSKETNNYFVNIAYKETVDGGMKEFVDVKIIYADEVIYDGTLTDLVGGRQIERLIPLERGCIYELKFIYSMSDEVGNEAQRTTTSFNITLSVIKED